MHLKKISFLCLKKKCLNMKNGQKKKRKEYILLKGRPEIIKNRIQNMSENEKKN